MEANKNVAFFSLKLDLWEEKKTLDVNSHPNCFREYTPKLPNLSTRIQFFIKEAWTCWCGWGLIPVSYENALNLTVQPNSISESVCKRSCRGGQIWSI